MDYELKVGDILMVPGDSNLWGILICVALEPADPAGCIGYGVEEWGRYRGGSSVPQRWTIRYESSTPRSMLPAIVLFRDSPLLEALYGL